MKQREATRSHRKQREATASNEKQRESPATSCKLTQRKGTPGTPSPGAGRTIRASAAQPWKQHRLAGTRSFARTHSPRAQTKRIRFPGWTHSPTSDHIVLFVDGEPFPAVMIFPRGGGQASAVPNGTRFKVASIIPAHNNAGDCYEVSYNGQQWSLLRRHARPA